MTGRQTKNPRGGYCGSGHPEDFAFRLLIASLTHCGAGECLRLAVVDELQVNLKVSGLEHCDNFLQVIAGLGGDA